MDAQQALQKLMEGNQRYLCQNMQNINQDLSMLKKAVAQQSPFAAVLTCADSRILPQVIFDQGIGDLFIIRVAGNVIDASVLGSVEYAVEYLGLRLVMVLGHSYCGAVTAALDDSKPAGHVSIITEAIKPAVEKAKLQKGDLLSNAIRENTMLSVNAIKIKSPDIIENLIDSSDLRVIGAIYDLKTGKVGVIDDDEEI